jgi:hypothetical protein
LPKHNSVAKQAKLNLDARKNVCPITREKWVPGTSGARGQVEEGGEGRKRGKNLGYTRRRKQQKGGVMQSRT